jgi:hypothetical protein
MDLEKEIPLKIESVEITAKERKLDMKWDIGFEVYRKPENLSWQETYDDRFWLTNESGYVHHQLLDKPEDVHVGDSVIVKDIFDYVWREMKVTKVEGNQAWAEDESVFTTLVFGEDKRNCWVSSGLIVRPTIDRLPLDRPPQV